MVLTLYYGAGCTSLLGMEKGGIIESQISASSVHSGILGLQHWGPELARLNNQGLVNAWSSAPQDKNPWIEVCQSAHLLTHLLNFFIIFFSCIKWTSLL